MKTLVGGIYTPSMLDRKYKKALDLDFRSIHLALFTDSLIEDMNALFLAAREEYPDNIDYELADNITWENIFEWEEHKSDNDGVIYSRRVGYSDDYIYLYIKKGYGLDDEGNGVLPTIFNHDN